MGNWIDIFCGSVLLILGGLGAYFGLVKTLVHLLAWVGGGVGVFYAPEFVEPFLARNLDVSETALMIFSRVVGFLLPFLSLRILGHFVNKFVKRHFSLANALGGGLLGLVKGAIPCLILLSTLCLLPLSGNLKSQRDASFAYGVYTGLLHSSGAGDAIRDAKDSVERKVKGKVDAVVDSVKSEALERGLRIVGD